MVWMKGGILALSLALNIYLVMRPDTAGVHAASSMEVRRLEWNDSTAPVAIGEVDKEPDEQSPLLEGWLRLSRSEWKRVGEQCFMSDEWALSELAAEALGLTAEQAGLVDQSLERMRQQVYLKEVERVEKHSDWHYTLGGLTESEVGDLKSAFQETLEGSLDSAQTEALTELTFAHRYFFEKGASWNMEIQMQPYRNHLGIQFGGFERRAEIPFEVVPEGVGDPELEAIQGALANHLLSDGPLVLVGHSKRIAHLIDLEAMWQRAFEETESLRKSSEP